MGEIKNVYGKSFLLNILFMVINLTGLTFLLFGYHESFESSALMLQIIGYFLFIAGLAGITIFQGWIMFSYVARVLVGGLFIVSGLIKANDPLGFSYKLEEYFEDGALAYRIKDMLGWNTFTLEYLIDYALAISVIICVLEIVLGVLAIIGGKIRLTSWLMLGMMVFFTLLTWHTKECDPTKTFVDVDTYNINESIAQIKIESAEFSEDITILKQTETTVTVSEVKKPQCVDDCGCFGDAMKGSLGRSLTPNESFWKDLILLYLVVLIFISQKRIAPNNVRENTLMTIFSLVFISIFSLIFGWGFPILFGLISILAALWIKRSGGALFGNDWGAALLVTIICSLFTMYILMYNPIKDYRPYAVGSDIREKMSDGVAGEYTNILTYKNLKTGENKTFTQDEYMNSKIWEEKGVWEHLETKTVTVKAGKLASITEQFNPTMNIVSLTNIEKELPIVQQFFKDNMVPYIDVIDKASGNHYPQLAEEFYAEDWDTTQYVIGGTVLKLNESADEINLLDYILDSERIFIVVSRNVKTADFSRVQRLLDIQEKANELNIPMLLMTTASKEDIELFREKTGLRIPYLINDETEIKAITRSNPTFMVIEKGVVKGKFSFRSTPSWEWLNKNIFNLE